jgi:hypothetical protein
MRRMLVITLVAICGSESIPPGKPLDFDLDIAPILISRCLDCHAGTEAKGKLDLSQAKGLNAVGKNGPAIVPGKPAESLLWQRIADNEMPPKHPLPDRERKLVKEWISQGAKWGTDPIDPYRITTAYRAGKDWWSLQSLAASKPVMGRGNPIDGFIAKPLSEKLLTPSPAADRRTLIRRVSFDLVGFPPTPEATRAFVEDPRVDAYERLIDGFLASPHYGERWARHWLDVAQYGESDGFEYDKMRPNAWRYRDWVIKAFNDNLPYDDFAKLQIAGDVLRPNDPTALTATGFLVGGAHDSLLPAGEPLRQIMRQDELENLVGLVGQTFLGMTVHCARCHDHKFDPIRQSDYYRMASALSGVHRGDRALHTQSPPAELTQRIEQLRRSIGEIEEPARQKVRGDRPSGAIKKPEPPKPMASWDFSANLTDTVGSLHGQAFEGAKIERGALNLTGRAYLLTEPLKKDLIEKTLEAWVQLANLDQKGGGVIGVQLRDGTKFDTLTFGERDAGQWMAGSNFYLRTQSFQAPSEKDAANRWVHVALTYAADGTISAYRDGKPYGKAYKSSRVETFKRGEAQVIFGIRHSPTGGNKHLSGQILKANLYDRVLSSSEIELTAAGLGFVITESDLTAVLTPEQRETRKRLTAELQEREEWVRAFREAKVFAITPKPAGMTYVLKRGNPQQPAERVSAGGLSALPGNDFALTPNAPESERRRSLAEWIASVNNPLFARTIVNRVWQHHFGRGLIDTPNDLGFSGGKPSHPDLLDWLAAEFIRSHFDIKALHRLILTSQAYRQSSAVRADAMQIDSDNRLLWRYSPRRLDAESIRDAMLAMSGQLNPEMGGPGYLDVRPYFFRGSQFYEPVDPVGKEFNRRSIYRMSARGGRNPLLDTFDCPDPSTMTPKRGNTTTPLQALSLMNSSFTLRMADDLAKRLKTDAGENVEKQIQRGFELVYGRPASEAEFSASRDVVTKFGLAPFCRALFNANGFLYVH